MKQITAKPARHICSVASCRNTDCFRVSGSPNLLGGFYICADCAGQIYKLTRPKKAAKHD